MINQYQQQRKQKILQIAKPFEEQTRSPAKQLLTVRKMNVNNSCVPYRSQSFISALFGKEWSNKIRNITSTSTINSVPRTISVMYRSDIHLRDWESQLKTNPYMSKKLPCRLIREPIPYSLRGKVYITMLPNHQYITNKLFQICKRRSKNVIEKQNIPFHTESTLFLIEQDLREIFSANFFNNQPELMKQLELLLGAFCVHRLEIGQKRAVARFAVLLHSYLNHNTMQVFVHLCHIACSSPFSSFTLSNQEGISKFLRNLSKELDETSNALYILFTKTFARIFRQSITRWIKNMFICLFFDDSTPHMDCIYNLESIIYKKDFIIDRILNFLFLRKFQQKSIRKVCICILMSLENKLLATQTELSVKSVLNRAKYYMDMTVFDSYLF